METAKAQIQKSQTLTVAERSLTKWEEREV